MINDTCWFQRQQYDKDREFPYPESVVRQY